MEESGPKETDSMSSVLKEPVGEGKLAEGLRLGALHSVCLCFLGRTGFSCDSLKGKGLQACDDEGLEYNGSVMDTRGDLAEGLGNGCHSSPVMQWKRGGVRRRVGRT